MKIVIDKLDNSVAALKVIDFGPGMGANPVHFVNSSLTFYEEGYQFSYKYKNGLSDGKRSLFNIAHNSFPLGLVPRVYKMLKKQYPLADISASPHILAAFNKSGGEVDESEMNSFIKTLGLPYDVRDYQMDMILTSVNNRRRALSACTGSGKSLVIYALSRWLLEKEDIDVLVIVPSMGLVEQIYSDFEEYGWESIAHYCSKLHSEVEKPTAAQRREMKKYNLLPEHMLKRIVVSTWQSLASKKPEFFKRFGAVICDEAHSAQAEVLSRIIANCRNAEFRVGLSGTIPTTGLNAHVVGGCIGPTEVIVTTAQLIKRGLLTPTKVIAIKIPYDARSKAIVKKMKYAEEVEATSLCGSAEELIGALITSKQVKLTENTIILVKHIELLNRIYDIINTKFPEFNAIKYHGGVGVKIRQQIRRDVEDSAGNFLICTYGTMKQGVNIKRVNNIIFGQGSSSLVTVKQSIGRGLRLHPDKKILKIYDIIDDLSSTTRAGNVFLNYANKHYLERLAYYQDDEYPVIEFKANFEASFDNIKFNK